MEAHGNNHLLNPCCFIRFPTRDRGGPGPGREGHDSRVRYVCDHPPGRTRRAKLTHWRTHRATGLDIRVVQGIVESQGHLGLKSMRRSARNGSSRCRCLLLDDGFRSALVEACSSN